MPGTSEGMAQTYRLVVGPGDVRRRLDRFLVEHLPATLSRTAIQRAILAGQVSVNGRARKANRGLKTGDVVVANLEGEAQALAESASLLAEPIPLEIVYEDEALLVVNKPAGLVTHPAVGHWTGTLANAVLWHLHQQARGWELGAGSDRPPSLEVTPSPQLLAPSQPHSRPPLPRAGIVHRLDKDTSGLLVVAKTDAALWRLSQQLQSRTMSRRYLAVVEGHVPFDEGTVEAAIGRHRKDRQLMAVRYLGGRQAVTHYRVLKRFQQGEGSRVQGEGDIPPPPSTLHQALPRGYAYTVLEVSLETGRTHQIRVHLAHLGYPILGDVTYGRRPPAYWQAHGVSRHWLHAYAIRFLHPMTDAPVKLSVPLPPDLAGWLAQTLGSAALTHLLKQVAAPPRPSRR